MASNRLVSFDIGTNTILLLIAEIQNGTITTILERETIVGLGRGVDRTRLISADAMARGLTCLQYDLELCQRYGCTEIFAVGTSVLRDADNTGEFTELVRTTTNLDIKVISGAEEAKLNFLGAISNKTSLPTPVGIFDIGGGSTEFVVGNSGEVLCALSLDLGSVRLTERFLQSDPVTTAEVQALRKFVHGQLSQSLAFNVVEFGAWIGTGGTMTTLATMAEQSPKYDAVRFDGYMLSRARLEPVLVEILQRSVAERRHLIGLVPERAEVIAGGALLCEAILGYFSADHVMISTRDLRYGVILAGMAAKRSDLQPKQE